MFRLDSCQTCVYTHLDGIKTKTELVPHAELRLFQPSLGHPGDHAVLRCRGTSSRRPSDPDADSHCSLSPGGLAYGGVERLSGHGPHHPGAKSSTTATKGIR